jgi:hypothetical protein
VGFGIKCIELSIILYTVSLFGQVKGIGGGLYWLRSVSSGEYFGFNCAELSVTTTGVSLFI